MNALAPISDHYSHTPCAVHLHGRLGTLFGETVVVPATTVSSAVRNVLIRHPGLINVLEEGEYRVVRGSLERGFDLDDTMLDMRIGAEREIHIFPVARGSGGGHGGVFKSVLGAVLIVAAVAAVVFQPELAGVIGPQAAGFVAASAGTIGLFGVSLLLGGLSRLISPQPGLGASYLLNGNFNTAQQGTPVPLVYGTARVGSVVIASSYAAEDYNTSTSDYEGSSAYYNSSGGYSGTLDAFDTGNPLPSGASGKGGGGKGGGSGGGGIEAPNTLESKAIVRLIDLISEGPITGLVNGPQSIFFNNTPLMNADGTWNFRGVGFTYLFGTPDQAPIQGYPSATETVTVGDQVFYGTPVIQQLESTTATQARVTIELPALYATNTQNGDINPSTLSLTVEVAEVTGTSVGAYTEVVNDVINGKCTSPYQKSYVFDLPGSGPGGSITAWNVRVTKTTAESAVSTTINQLYWSTYDLIENYQLMYPNSACIALEIDSEAFGSNLPTRLYLVQGIQVQVPANYNATTRTYATTGPGTLGGSWDYTTFTAETTSNPAWILYDFMSNSRYGLGLPAQNLETAAIQLYTIAQYCDGLVPDGNGNTEPRYELNGVFNQRVDAFKLLQAIAATFRGQIYWAGGQVCVSCDMPQSPVKIYSAANVIGGNFVYEGTSRKTRRTVANVHFTDPSNQYNPGVEIVELPPQVAQRGVFSADILGFGVTSRGLAHRLGNWLLYTENLQTETVTFSVSWDSAFVMPGNLIQIADLAIAGVRMGGRLRPSTTLSALALDMPFTPATGQSYSASVILEDGTLEQQVTVASFTNVTKSYSPFSFSENFVTDTALQSSQISFSRASTATYINSSGVMQTAAINAPRFDYSTGSQALLIEPAATNFVASGQNSISGFGSPAITPNAATAPDGTMTATQIVCEGEMFLNSGSITGAPANFCCSVWMRATAAVTVTAVSQGSNNATGWSATWNVTTQWQRFYVSGAQPNTVYSLGLCLFAPNGSTLFVWGAQVEAGLVPTSTILTSGTAVTRLADVLTATLGENFLQMAGTLMAEIASPTSAAATISMQNGAAQADTVSLTFNSGSVGASAVVGTHTTTLLSAANVGAPAREALSWNGDGAFQQAVNGNLLGLTSLSPPAQNLNAISVSVSAPLSLRRLAFYPFAKTNGDLATLSGTSFDPASEIQTGASYTIANLATPLPKPVLPGSMFILQDATITPTEWQVVGITEMQRGIFEIVAAQYNPNKFSLVEEIPTLTVPAFSTLPASLIAPLAPPTNVAAMTTLSGQGTTTLIKTFVSWTMPVDARILQYQVSVVNSEGTTVAVLAVTGASTEVDGLSPDTYYFSVRSLGANGSTSAWAYSSPLTITGQSATAPGAPTGLTGIAGNRSAYLQWTAASGLAIQFYNVWRSSTTIPPGQSGSIAALIGTSGGTSYNDADAQTLTPGTTWYYWVQAVTTTDVVGALSASATVEIAYILGSDIGNGAISTINQFAAALQPIGVWTAASLPANPAAAGGANSIVWSHDNQTYNWNSTTSTWQTATNSISASNITAGTLEAGVILGSLANFGTVQISSAQIQDLTVTTSLIAANAISESSAMTLATQSIPAATATNVSHSGSITVNVPEGAYVILFINYVATNLGPEQIAAGYNSSSPTAGTSY